MHSNLVSSGYLDCTVQNNSFYGNNFNPNDHNAKATAIRITSNSFGFNVTGNRINGGSKGIRYAGTMPGNTYPMLVLNSKFTNNSFFGLSDVAMEFENGNDSLISYNNIVNGNSFVSCGHVSVKGQKNMIFCNNLIKDTNLYLDTIDESLITENYFQGGNVVKATLGNRYAISNNAGIS